MVEAVVGVTVEVLAGNSLIETNVVVEVKKFEHQPRPTTSLGKRV